jgi:serine-type D-Ala-D-Ala carboxypeptidase/endopeptidase (penicillin-binding protein 4)
MSSNRWALVLLLSLTATACATHTPRSSPAVVATLDDRTAAAKDLAALFAEPAVHRVFWGVVIRSLDRPGDALFTLNPDQLFVPASNTKLLTVAAAADRLGWNFTFDTTIRATTPLDPDGTIRGDIVVRGSGDPTAGDRPPLSGAVATLADALRQRGVRRIEGRVIGDDHGFLDEPYGAGWAWDDLPFGYSAPVGALNYDENVRLRAPLPGPSDTPHYTSVDNPTIAFADALRAALVARGIAVLGGAADIDASPPGPLPANAPVLASYTSPPLGQIAVRLLKSSQNLYAEVFLRAIGRTSGQAASTKVGLDAIRETFASWGIEPGTVAQADGSGLSRYNLATPWAMTKVLEHMYRDVALRDGWMAALPVAGVDGTLEKRMKGTPAEGQVFAKTGSLSSVRALSGYIHARSGEWFVFSILANNFAPTTSTDIDHVVDQAVERVAAISSRP